MVQCVCHFQLPTSVSFPAPKCCADAKQLSIAFCLFYPSSEVKNVISPSFLLGYWEGFISVNVCSTKERT